MLTLAASMDGTDDDVATAKVEPSLRGYVEQFGREGDLGVIAHRGAVPVGAAWGRLLAGEPHPSKLWTLEEPELAIATVTEERGQGVGDRLLSAWLVAAAGRYPAVVLSVREGNPAVRLYERHGFVVVERIVNRVGGISLAMRRTLT
jgi:ribosomal protein S18 acetylase RimI-like enzyme